MQRFTGGEMLPECFRLLSSDVTSAACQRLHHNAKLRGNPKNLKIEHYETYISSNAEFYKASTFIIIPGRDRTFLK